MNYQIISKYRASLLIALLTVSFVMIGCKQKLDAVKTQTKSETYTCPMHPQVVQEGPGTCPICGMDLVPFAKSNNDDFLTLSESQVTLGNITTVAIGSTELTNNKILNGRLALDPEQSAFISSRVAGRIEKLYVKEIGVEVHKGQPLYKIYSEELAALQQEYLLGAAQAKEFSNDARFQQIFKAAGQKLLLYEQTPTQLQQLISAGKVDPFVTYPAPMSGVVAEIMVTEGQYVSEGGPILRTENYKNLWVEADLYPGEAAGIRQGQKLEVTVPGWEDKPQSMTVQFINPSFEAGSQLLQIRGSITNPGSQWQPGLQASLTLPIKSKAGVLSLPVNAVIRNGQGMHVWIEEERGKFSPRMVTTGMENENTVEIVEGLKAGEKVVVTGAYLLYSEYILKKGRNPMAGHNHG